MVINLALSNFDVKFFGFQHVHPRDRSYFFTLNTNQDPMGAIKPTALLEIATEFSSCSKTGKSNGAFEGVDPWKLWVFAAFGCFRHFSRCSHGKGGK